MNPLLLNVGSGDAISIRDLARAVVEELKPLRYKIEIARQPEPVFLEQYVPDVQEAGTCLGLRQTIGLREAIRRTAAWYR
jgi:nucleoside-diphosphate-sugar epimerase